jgi:hypothetical protein
MSELEKSNSSLPIFLMGGKTIKNQAYSGMRCTPLDKMIIKKKRKKRSEEK